MFAHTLLIGLAVYLTPDAPLPSDNRPLHAILVDIEPYARPDDIPARISPSPSSVSDSALAFEDSTSVTRPNPRRPAEALEQPTRHSENPSLGDASGSVDPRWTYAPESLARATARGLRTSVLGCDYPDRLTEGERQVCAERATDRAVRKLEEGQRITGTGDTRRDARFEQQGRQRMQNYNARRRAIRADETGNVGPSDSPGSNFGLGPSGRHLDPSLQPDAVGPIQRNRTDGRPEDRIRRTPH